MLSRIACVGFMAALLGSVTFGGAFAEDKKADGIAARVDGEVIKQSEVEKAIDALGAQAQQMPKDVLYKAMLDRLVSGKLVTKAAKAEKLQDDKDYKEQVKETEASLLQQAYIEKAVDARLTDDVVKVAYEKYVKEHPAGDEVRASHILVKSEDEAKDIIKHLQGGADFATLAKEKSTDKASAENGGDLDFFQKDTMVKEFATAAFAMKVGETSTEPVKSAFGYHIIKVTDRRQAEPPKFEAVKDDLKKQLARQEVQKVVEELRSKAKIEEFNPDGTPLVAEADAPKAEKPAAKSDAEPAKTEEAKPATDGAASGK